MKRNRGFMLLYALAVLAIMIAVVLLLAQSIGVRVDRQRDAAARDDALRHAETALEQARAAVESKMLAAGNSTTIDGLNVACTGAAGNRLKLETFALYSDASAGRAPGDPRRGVHVTWELQAPPENSAGAWTLSAWQTRHETVAR